MALPAIVQQRLKELLPAGPHPDESLLAGFVEHELTEPIQTAVLGHLLACPECRRVVAISRPEIVSPARAAVAPRWYWPRWPSLRWAQVVATAAFVVGAAWIGRIEVKTMSHTASVQMATAGTGSGPAQEAHRNLPTGIPTGGKTNPTLRRPSTPSVTAAESKMLAGSHQPNSVARGELAPGQLASAPDPEASSTDMINTRFAAHDKPVALSPSAPGQADATGPALTWQENISLSASASSTSSTRRPLPPNRTKQMKWMVSQTGTLYQSFDDGVRWQSVAVRENVELRSVWFSADDIWVGGKAGALFHSSDAGHHWTQVVPACNGLTLLDDIARVEFTDPNHGSITTPSGQTCATADHGQTWETR